MDHDENLRRLKRELELVKASAITLTIPSTQLPWWRAMLLPRKNRKILETARNIEREWQDDLAKPTSREDHELLRKRRSTKEIYSDIGKIPDVQTNCVEVDELVLSGLEVRQMWYGFSYKCDDRDGPQLFFSDPLKLTDGVKNSIPFQGSEDSIGENEPIRVHSGKTERTSLSLHGQKHWPILSEATCGVLRGALEKLQIDRSEKYYAYFFYSSEFEESSDSPPMWAALFDKESSSCQWFKLTEFRE